MDSDQADQLERLAPADRKPARKYMSERVDWYSKGDGVIVEANGSQIIVRVVDRKGRRDRLAITAPPGAVFRPLDRDARDETDENVR